MIKIQEIILKKKTLKQARASQRHLKQLSSQINYFKQA
jgi:hypothetical protein